MKWISACFLFSIFSLLGCADKQREERLKQREEALSQKENLFALKEAEYQSLLKMRDSLLSIQKDTIVPEGWPEFVTGLWNSKVICTQSTCGNYVVGDVRTDQWEFGYDSTRLIAKVSSNNKLVRVYNGNYKDSVISLSFLSDSTSQKRVAMNISLTEITPDKLKGTRIVNVDNACSATFSVELIKNKTDPE